MQNKKTILLPRTAFANATDEDVYINLELSRSVKDIKNDKINNVFNIPLQYDIERQKSLKFCIYGLVDSVFCDTNHITFSLKDSSGLTLNLPKISSDCISQKSFDIKTYELTRNSNMSKNIYDNNKSAYSFLFEIDATELANADAMIISGSSLPSTRSIIITVNDPIRNIFFTQSIPYLFYDLSGNPVKFGSQTADVDDSGNIIEINNDFAFLYDRHWVKTPIVLPAPSFIYFTDSIINVPIDILGGQTQFQVQLDQPSSYGYEEATVILRTDLSTINNNITEFDFSPQTLNWGIGDQYQNVNLKLFNTNYVENIESLVFEIVDLKNCVPNTPSGMTMQVNIIDNNKPSQITFNDNNTSLKSDAIQFSVNYSFDKALTVPGQNIELYINSASTAVIGTDFILDRNNPTAQSILLNFNSGDTSGSTIISIIDNSHYDLDKNIILNFRNPSQNISIGNTGNDLSFGQACNITIKDTLNTLYSTFTFVNNQTKKVGAVRAYKSPDAGQYYFNSDAVAGFSPAAGKYDISVYNNGAEMIYEGNLISAGSLVTVLSVTSQTTSDIVFNLPSNINFNSALKSYLQSNYSFVIKSKEQFIADIQPQNSTEYQLGYSYPEIVINNVTKDAGILNSKAFYLTSQLNNFFLNYDGVITSACTINNFNLIPKSLTNSLLFLGYNISNVNGGNIYNNNSLTKSSVDFSFEESKVSNMCSQYFAFGFDRLPTSIYSVRNLNLNFRNLYPQSGPVFSGITNNLKIDAAPNAIGGAGFLNFQDALDATKNAMDISITNNGEISANIMGNMISQGNSFIIRNSNLQSLNNLVLTLPANELYTSTTNEFLRADYTVVIENVSYYNTSGALVGQPSKFVFDGTSALPTASGSTSLAPVYSIVSEYNNIKVPYQIGNDGTFSVLDCANNFTSGNGNLRNTNVAIKGILLTDSNTNTVFVRSYFVAPADDIVLTCVNNTGVRIPFMQL